MSYFTEIPDYKSYSHGEADFHFIYNANSGGGQSFLGGQFFNEKGTLSSPTILDGKIGVFAIMLKEQANINKYIQLDDEKGQYEIKPRGNGSTSMKLGVGTTKATPNKLISSCFMLPPTCNIKSPNNLDISILTSNNFWLHSMWLECKEYKPNFVNLLPLDFIFSGGNNKENPNKERFFKLDAQKRIKDIISLYKYYDYLPIEILQVIALFAKIYLGQIPYNFEKCCNATNSIMSFLAKTFPDKYSGIEDPLPFLMSLNKIYHSNQNKDFMQKIYFGTPGSVKSWKVENEVLPSDEKYIFRTTFHPDTDYSSFVGCYKPQMKDGKIGYGFASQVFTDAYVAAWNGLSENEKYYLVIEEINRGNCAQIFGDLFQLLDRKKESGYSEYPIKADNDLRDYLEHAETEDGGQVLINKEGIKDGKLCLPPNLNIIATMNTSDQSLFPMDSAFKRRWSWEYVPIRYDEPKSAAFLINIPGSPFEKWVDFLKKINGIILEKTQSEDKQMGNYFIKGDIGPQEFKDKVMFYLWSEVCKDCYQSQENFFRAKIGDNTSEFSYNMLYDEKGDELLVGFLNYIVEYKLKEDKKV